MHAGLIYLSHMHCTIPLCPDNLYFRLATPQLYRLVRGEGDPEIVLLSKAWSQPMKLFSDKVSFYMLYDQESWNKFPLN